MAKVLLLNGSPNEQGCTYTALMEVKKSLEKNGVETELLQVGSSYPKGCNACRGCKNDNVCLVGDSVSDICRRIDEFDGIIAGSPVYYAGPSAQICAFMDRLFFSCGRKMRGKVAAAVVSCRRGGAQTAFERLNMYFGMNNMVVITSQYWNEVHGNTHEQVQQDIEGLQTMRTLGENMAWVLRCIDAGKAAGVKGPEYETPIATNFIR